MPFPPDAFWPTPDLAANEIHVWQVDLPSIAGQLEAFTRILPKEERTRAGRFFFESDQRNFLLRRAILRRLIAGYLGISPNAVALRYTPAGKPVLDKSPRGLEFSLSHSSDLVLIAISRELPIGVDVERERPFHDMIDIVRRYFSLEEQLEFFALPHSVQKQAFYCGWTRKEAVLKVIGQGLAFGLSHLTVTLNPNEPARLVSIEGRKLPASDWSLYSLIPLPGYTGAVAVRGTEQRVTRFQLETISTYNAND